MQTNNTSSTRQTKVASAVSGLLMLALGGFIIISFPIDAVLPEGFRTPMIAFEFAEAPSDIAYLAGYSDKARVNRAHMAAFLHWDMLFLLAYTGFLFLLFWQLTKDHPRLALVGLIATLAIIPLDVLENLTLLDIVSAMANDRPIQGLLSDLHLQTWLKWGAICTALSALSLTFYKNHEYWSATLGTLAAMSIAVCYVADAKPIWAELMGACLLSFFVLFTLKEVLYVLRIRRLDSRRLSG